MRKVLGLASIMLIGTAIAGAQSQNGSVSGVITDASGAVVSGATVTLTGVANGLVRTAQTTSSGAYTLQGIAPQDYRITVSAPGFGTTATDTFNVSVGSSNTFNAKLAVQSSDEKVEVAANSLAGINLENAEQSQVINSTQLTELPSESRNAYAFVSLSGNVSSDPTAGARGVGVNAGGARAASTEILLDGIENTYLFSVGVATSVPIDAVQEYRVITSNYGPEYGRASGGVVNVVTKAGTNKIHGSVWDFNRLSTFASQSTYNKANGIAQHRFTRNEFGFVIGGPIIKDKLFFFGGNEWLRIRSSSTTQFLTPTSQFLALSSPATQSFFTTYGTLVASVVGAPITLGQLNAAPGLTPVTKLFATDYTALRATPGFTDATPIFQTVQETAFGDAGGGTPQNTYNPIGRMDFNLSERTQMYARYILSNAVTPVGTGNISPYAGYNTTTTTKAQDVVYSITHTFNPRLSTTVALAGLRVNQNSPLGDRPVGPTLYTGTSAVSVGGITIALPGYSELNPANGLPSGGPQNDIVVSPVVTFVKGAHSMTFGGQYTYIRDNHNFGIYENPQVNLANSSGAGALVAFQTGTFNAFQTTIDPQGKFPCAKNFTTGATPGMKTNNGTAAFDPTCTVTTPINQPQFARSNRYQEGAAFVNDIWKATPRLTLNIGLRYELYGTQHNKNSALDSNFYFGTSGTLQDRIRAGKILNVNAVAPPGVQSPNGKLWKTNYKQFAPRLGFAYDLTGDGKTSLRGGYGISYERNFGNVTYNVALNPPGEFAISITSVGDNGGVPFQLSNGLLGPFSSGAGIQKALPAASARAVDPNIKPAYNQFYTLALERQVANGFAVGLSYTGERGIHGYSIANYNRLYYGQVYENDATSYTLAVGSPNSLKNTNRLNNQYTGINVRGADTDSYYNGLNLSVRANDLYKTGITMTANYTLSHSTDDSSSTFATDGGSNDLNNGISYFDPFNKALDHGSSDFDEKHRISIGLIYKVPTYNMKGFVRAAVAGFEIGTQYIAVTGTPFTEYDSTLPQSGNGVYARAHFNIPVPRQRTGASTPVSGSPDFYNYINFPVGSTGTYGDPKLGYADMPTIINGMDTFGNMSARNTFRGPGSQTFNADAIKNIQLSERYSIQLRAELYNVLNHPNEYLNSFGSNDIGSTNFAETYRSVGPGTADNRQLQLAGKFIF